MPQKNRVKIYVENGFYHIYNRGVEKRDIFLDDQDYRVFLHLLKYYLTPQRTKLQHPLINAEGASLVRPRPLANLDKEIVLLAYCLMPNHFHLLLQQKTIAGMPKLLRRISTTYAMYFNRRYKRVGHLFEGTYKAAIVETDAYLLHVSRYIHLNPAKLTRSDLVSYSYSSYSYYLRLKSASWLVPDIILSYFQQVDKPTVLLKQPLTYQRFVEDYFEDSKEVLGGIAID